MTTNHSKQVCRSPSPAFHKVGENLYRHTASQTYYALLKRAGKQFRRSLKTTDRALAVRRLAALRQLVGSLSISEDSKAPFSKVATRWLDTVRHTMKPASVNRRETCIKNLISFFKGQSVRNIKPSHLDVECSMFSCLLWLARVDWQPCADFNTFGLTVAVQPCRKHFEFA
jgi:integrase-like protein